jgi:hypothetical protein
MADSFEENMKEILDILQSTPKVVEDAYSDGVSAPLKESSKLVVDTIKTIRLMLFPLQLGSYLQDRLTHYLVRAVEQVPEGNLIKPTQPLLFQICEQLKFQESGSLISELYINLLSRGMDKERVSEAHPAFIHFISQLSPDEIVLFTMIASSEGKIYFRFNREKTPVASESSKDYINSLGITQKDKASLITDTIEHEKLAQPHLFLTFLEHLVTLGIVQYSNSLHDKFRIHSNYSIAREFFSIEKSLFGELFFNACIKKSP